MRYDFPAEDGAYPPELADPSAAVPRNDAARRCSCAGCSLSCPHRPARLAKRQVA